MAVKSANMAKKKGSIPAHKVYKELDMTLKDFKSVCAELDITIKGAVSKLTEDQVERIKSHMGIGEAEEPAEEPAEEKLSTEEQEAAKKAEAEKKAEEAEREKERTRLKAIADKLGVEPDHVPFVAQVCGVDIESPDDVEDEIIARIQKLEIVFKIAGEFKIDPRDVSRIARGIGLEVGRKGFKGLSPNEEFMLRAMVKQKHTTQEERLAEVQKEEEEEYKPAPPTGNKAIEAREKEQKKRQKVTKDAKEVIPERFREQKRGRGRRERFEVSQLSYDRPRGGRRQRRDRRNELLDHPKKAELPTGPVTVELPTTMRDLSEAMGVKTNEIMRRMIMEGLPPVRINQTLTKEIIEQIGIIFEREMIIQEPKDAEDLIAEQLEKFDEESGHVEPRAPIVTIMGHVDHGKTSLLDAIATLDRVSEESGGITQHIGAFRLDLLQKDGKFIPFHEESHREEPADAKRLRVTFIDTPGHEAFTEMRARGANVTDIAVIVVAADDGVMPQTEEAISHARAAEVEIVVAITKIDKPEANLAKVRQQLAGHNLMDPEWGGTTEIIELSSITGEGVDKLVTVLSDYSDLLELKAVPDKPAVGTVLEAHRDPGRGIVATMLVKEGNLRRGDVIVAGHGYGRVRAMQEPRGDGLYPIEEAGPSIPVEVAGLDEMPEAGSLFHGMKDLKKAAEIADMVRQQELNLARSTGFSLEEWSKARAGQAVKELVIVLKCDVQGTAETIKAELAKLQHDEVRVKVVHSAVGQITTTDVHLAEAADGIVVGFHVGVDAKARELADNHHVDVRTYEVIYKLIEEIRDALGGMLAPELVEVYQGTAEIRKVFKVSKVGKIAGCMVTKGFIKRDSKVRLVRDGTPIYETDILSLKREKDDASEVREGYECGIQIKGYDDIKEGDVLEAFRVEEHKRSLDD